MDDASPSAARGQGVAHLPSAANIRKLERCRRGPTVMTKKVYNEHEKVQFRPHMPDSRLNMPVAVPGQTLKPMQQGAPITRRRRWLAWMRQHIQYLTSSAAICFMAILTILMMLGMVAPAMIGTITGMILVVLAALGLITGLSSK